ncbi:trichohyalin isoform X3 [Harmonia axyridis]|uniref:trichohyalin isoform X3 n=1 Tax=Harmonia axyridis TaxID=115357 RepID=UPI001E27892D|nr:trichohyalin isoform X3 [Harmonia axyridis]
MEPLGILEIRDYAVKIGIDPNDEPQLLPIAAEGLMQALPAAWKPCFDEKSKSYYYYNRNTGKTQWEHPLDSIYRNIVKKAKTDSQSYSLGEPTDDATFARDDLPSLEEPPAPNLLPKKLEPLVPKLRDKSASPRRLRRSPTVDLNISPRHESKFVKQKSEDHILINRKLSVNAGNSSGEDLFEKHPRMFETKPELKVTGGGNMFLKTHTKKLEVTLDGPKAAEKRSILKENLSIDGLREVSSDADTKVEMTPRSNSSKETEENDNKPEEDDKRSVRFTLLKEEPEIRISDRSVSEEDQDSSRKSLVNPVLQVSFAPQNKIKSPFALAMETEVLDKPPLPKKHLKVIKPNPSDFIKPTLMRTRSSDSEDDSVTGRVKRLTMEEIDLDSENSLDSPNDNHSKKTMQMERMLDKRVERFKDRMWRTKNKELTEFQENLEDSQREELKRIMARENETHETKIAEELKKLRAEAEKKNEAILEEERKKLREDLEKLKLKLVSKFDQDEKEMKEHFEKKKDELEKYYEEKLVEIENSLADNMERNRDEIVLSHNSVLEQLRENNTVICEQLKKEFKIEEDQLRADHKNKMKELRDTFAKELETKKTGDKCDQDEKYIKLMGDKKSLEDKYKCLKEKYMRLKTDVRTTIEKRNKKKEEGRSGATTTGSETEKSFSIPKDRASTSSSQKNTDKPPTSKPPKPKAEIRGPKETSPNDVDTSLSDRSEDKNKLDYDTSDNSLSHGRSRKKLFTRMRSNSATRMRSSKTAERSCSPVENLRRQLQKLEDLEDQFPQSQQSDTYHLRYPFSDSHKFEGCSELEFFRHRIHLERDSIKRAKESLRNQKTIFQQRQKELKLKHGSMARHTYQQLCQEEKDLTDMEVSLHRTRSLLGEKVIRLRHLEQTLQRATVTNDSKYDDATLSDLSSHSASSGISSTEFLGIDMHFSRSLPREDSMQEPSEIIQSLENLNSEIRDIWEVLRKQQQQSGGIAAVIPPFVYPDLGWPVLAGAAASLPAPPSIPTLADRLNSYRQHLALANAQSTVVTHAANQGATTSLVERTRNLRHWLKQAGIENNGETSNPQADL